MIGRYRPAMNIEPGWQVRVRRDDGWEWPDVSLVIEGEDDQGNRILQFVFDGGRMAGARENDRVMCRTPEEVHTSAAVTH